MFHVPYGRCRRVGEDAMTAGGDDYIKRGVLINHQEHDAADFAGVGAGYDQLIAHAAAQRSNAAVVVLTPGPNGTVQIEQALLNVPDLDTYGQALASVAALWIQRAARGG